jgi:hypothetical protein
MVQNPKTRPPSPPLCGEQLTSLVVGHLVTRMEVEAAQTGGMLTVPEIRAIAEKFLTAEIPHFHAAFKRNYEECTSRREEQRWSGIRKYPFDRILTKKFAHLFPARKGDDGGSGLLSRRVIPGFTLAIQKMIGPMLYEQCQRKTRAIMDRYTDQQSGYDWNSIYADPESQALANDVLVVVAHYFSEFDRRRGWFMDLINNNLAPPPRQDLTAPDDALSGHWQLTPHGFAEAMRALFNDLDQLLTTTPDQIRTRYGDHTVLALEAFIKRLNFEN